MDLGVDLDSTIFWYHVLGYRDSFMDRNALFDYGVVLHAKDDVSNPI